MRTKRRRRTKRYSRTTTSDDRRSRTGRVLGLLVPFLFLVPCLMVTMSMAGPDISMSRDDGNDSFATAGQAAIDVQTFDWLYAANDTEDFFWFEAEKGEIIEVHFIIMQPYYNFSDPEEVDFDLEIYGPLDHSTPLAYSRTTDQFEIESLVAAVTGKYHFRAYVVNGGGEYGYMVEVYDAVDMEDGRTYHDYVKKNSHDDADWYKVHLEGGNPAQAVSITLTHDTTGNLDLFLMDLWNKKGPYWLNLSWWMGPSTEEVFGVASYTGYYYLKVHAYSGYGNYQLKAVISEVATDNNNDKGRATFLEYNMTWADHVDQAADRYDYFEVRLLPQENISIDLRLLNGWDHIYSVLLLDVDLKVVWEGTNYIFEPEHDTGPDIEFSRTVDGGVYFVVVMAKVALTEDPDNLSDGTAAADYTIVINMSKHPERPPNNPPTIKAGMEDLTITMDEDTTEYLSLTDVFEDKDGDQLAYTATEVGGPGDLRVSVDLSGTVTIIPKADWFGVGNINFTAEDPEGERVWLVVKVTVNNLPEPPIVMDYWPSRTWSMAEGENVTFRVEVADWDSLYNWFNWTVDDIDQDTHVIMFTYRPGYDDAGVHRIVIVITDGDVVVEWDWDVTVNETNRQPEIISVKPKDCKDLEEGEKVNLVVVARDPDGDTLSYEWRKGLQIVGKTSDINHTFPPGKHIVQVQVIDQHGAVNSTEVCIKVQEKDPVPSWSVLAVGFLVAAVVASIIYSYAVGGKKVDEDEIDRGAEKEFEKEEGMRKGKARGRKGGKGKKRKGKERPKQRTKKRTKERRKEVDEDLDEEVEREMRAERKRMKKKKRSARK